MKKIIAIKKQDNNILLFYLEDTLQKQTKLGQDRDIHIFI